MEFTILIGALWLGILTSISPCPLATNIAAVAFLSRRSTEKRAVMWSSFAYIAGRMIAYTLLAYILTAGLLSAPEIAEFMRSKFTGLIGPGLILVGMFVAGWISLKIPQFGNLNELGIRLAGKGILGELLMGAVFAMAFCPVSAALYFGGLIPSVMQTGSNILLPIIYGIGTAVPVVVAVIIIAGGVQSASSKIKKMQSLGSKLQVITGGVLVAIGVWLTLQEIMA